jgi:hypothetical protein
VTLKPNYDTTLARIAADFAIHVAGGRLGCVPNDSEVAKGVAFARAIVAEIKRTEPRKEPK